MRNASSNSDIAKVKIAGSQSCNWSRAWQMTNSKKMTNSYGCLGYENDKSMDTNVDLNQCFMSQFKM